MKLQKKSFGIIGGLGALASADVFFKLVKATPQNHNLTKFDFVFEQRTFEASNEPGSLQANQVSRKLYIYDRIKDFEKRNIDAVILPCFISHTFIKELKTEVKLPIVDMMDSLKSYIKLKYPKVKKIGVLTSDFVKNKNLFDQYFESPIYQIIYPNAKAQTQLMEAIYADNGLQKGYLQGESIEKIQSACADLLKQGAEIILPGFTEIAMVASQLQENTIPILDSNLIYAQYAFNQTTNESAQFFKVGVVGGVGPAATVDFMNKIIKNTKAKKDQEHIKLIVEHNPQIPDRTENLISDGADPSIALYATCKKLESNDANMIAIPCNTAHAFVEKIQPYLSIPIVNMLYETIQFIKTNHPIAKEIGLLATTGTIKSRVYHEVAEKAGLTLLTPNETNQALVMNSIYGEQGVKAGFVDGACKNDLLIAITHLVAQGANLIILGCTELPLIIPQSSAFKVKNKTIAILDPTEILAIKCVQLSTNINK